LAFIFASLGLAACEGRFDPVLVQGEYQAQMAQVQIAGSGNADSPLTLTLKLLPNDQAVLIKDFGKGQASSQYGLWSLSGNKLTITLFKPDPYHGGGEKLAVDSTRKVVEDTLVLRAKRSTRTLWLEDQPGQGAKLKGLEFKKL
jgi:hypothetical protein